MMKKKLKFPVVGTDRQLAFLREIGNTNLNFEMLFAQRLDEKRLAHAIKLLFEAEPILKCRFVYRKWNPYWEEIESTGSDFIFTTDKKAFNHFRKRYVNIWKERGFTACLFRDTEFDHLVLKIAHDICDAGGCKHLSLILSKMYENLKNEPDYKPIPNIKGSRGAWQVLKRIPWKGFFKIYLNYIQQLKIQSDPEASCSLPASPEQGDEPYVRVHHFDQELIEVVKQIGKQYHATINDIFIAAFLKAILTIGNWDPKSILRLTYTVDLRSHYLIHDKAQSLCNLSGFEHISLGNRFKDDLMDLLIRITACTQNRKSDYIGLNDYIGGMPIIKILPFQIGLNLFQYVIQRKLRNKNIHNTIITNMGPIEPESVTYDQPAENAWIIAPVMYPPFFGLGLTGYNNGITLSAGTYPPGITKDNIDQLLELMKNNIAIFREKAIA